MIPAELFTFAYMPVWYEQLYELSQMAAPEPWKFVQPDYETQNTDTDTGTVHQSDFSQTGSRLQ